VFVTFVLIFKFIFIYLLHVLFVEQIVTLVPDSAVRCHRGLPDSGLNTNKSLTLHFRYHFSHK